MLGIFKFRKIVEIARNADNEMILNMKTTAINTKFTAQATFNVKPRISLLHTIFKKAMIAIAIFCWGVLAIDAMGLWRGF